MTDQTVVHECDAGREERDLEGTEVEKVLGCIGPFPEVCFSQENTSLHFASTRHLDPQCFVQIEVAPARLVIY